MRKWRKLIDDAFRLDFALRADVTASEYRGEDSRYSPSKTTDADDETYWTTNDETTSAHLEIQLGKEREVKYLVIQEYISLGQRVKAFTVETWQNDSWQPIASATTIGYKRILRLNPTRTDRVRINITESRACPVISNVELY